MFHRVSDKPQPGMGVFPADWLESGFMPSAVRKLTTESTVPVRLIRRGSTMILALKLEPDMKALAEKKAAEKKAAEAKAAEKKLAEKQQADKKRQEEQKRREEADARKLAQLREENLKRLQQGLAGATGGPTATGDALRSAGPSDSYAGRIRARVKPNIIFTDDVPGNPVTEVEVRMAPDGTITQRRITRKSGIQAWDDAVLRALDRTEVLPRDVDGRVHSPLLIEFRVKG